MFRIVCKQLRLKQSFWQSNNKIIETFPEYIDVETLQEFNEGVKLAIKDLENLYDKLKLDVNNLLLELITAYCGCGG